MSNLEILARVAKKAQVKATSRRAPLKINGQRLSNRVFPAKKSCLKALKKIKPHDNNEKHNLIEFGCTQEHPDAYALPKVMSIDLETMHHDDEIPTAITEGIK
ncbi:hypothetical protein GEMRC1_004697 [Eukaryota sp. GEM-RC1]